MQFWFLMGIHLYIKTGYGRCYLCTQMQGTGLSYAPGLGSSLGMTVLLNRTLCIHNLGRTVTGNNKCIEGMLYRTRNISRRLHQGCSGLGRFFFFMVFMRDRNAGFFCKMLCLKIYVLVLLVVWCYLDVEWDKSISLSSAKKELQQFLVEKTQNPFLSAQIGSLSAPPVVWGCACNLDVTDIDWIDI